MRKKTYRSKSVIAINVVMPSGKSRHVSFTAQSNGTSLLATDDTALQRALEAHCGYGRLFHLVEEESKSAVHMSEVADESPASPEIIKVSDLAAAKDYLADHLGVSRTTLRNRKAIEEAARSHGIVFEGI